MGHPYSYVLRPTYGCTASSSRQVSTGWLVAGAAGCGPPRTSLPASLPHYSYEHKQALHEHKCRDTAQQQRRRPRPASKQTAKPRQPADTSPCLHPVHVMMDEAVPPSPQQSRQQRTISLSARCSHSAFTREAQTVQCMASLRACAHTPVDRKPIDLVLVIDKSGSMGMGGKLELTKETAEMVARELSGRDRLSIITYDTDVACIMPLLKMDVVGKVSATQAIASIRPGTCTNLSGGLLRGLEELAPDKVSEPADTTSVFLMTDGLANAGIVDQAGIVRCVEGVLSSRGTAVPPCTVFTFGYGADHNAEMLRAISDAGSGQCAFAPLLVCADKTGEGK
jgi:Mg-chelatase subunit ChlD